MIGYVLFSKVYFRIQRESSLCLAEIDENIFEYVAQAHSPGDHPVDLHDDRQDIQHKHHDDEYEQDRKASSNYPAIRR